MTDHQEPRNRVEDPNREKATCPLCEAPATTTVVDDTFTYGSGSDAVDLDVRLPVRRCDTCDIDFLDHVGERIQTEAVYRHHGLLTPWEIRAIRDRRNLSRAAFAEITGLGEATIKRWETGATAQNRGNDRYLRLLNNDSCWSLLQRIVGPEPPITRTRVVVVTGPWRRLTKESEKELRQAKDAFSLHKRHVA